MCITDDIYNYCIYNWKKLNIHLNQLVVSTWPPVGLGVVPESDVDDDDDERVITGGAEKGEVVVGTKSRTERLLVLLVLVLPTTTKGGDDDDDADEGDGDGEDIEDEDNNDNDDGTPPLEAASVDPPTTDPGAESINGGGVTNRVDGDDEVDRTLDRVVGGGGLLLKG